MIAGVETKVHILNGKDKAEGEGAALGEALHSQSQPSSDIIPITRPHLQTYTMPPQWALSVQMSETMGKNLPLWLPRS